MTTFMRRAEEMAELPARLALGSAMLYHGVQKLRGGGMEETAQWFESVGLRPGRRMARAAGWAETLAGAATLLGIGTRAAALAVMGTQAVAIWKVHRPKGYAVSNGGMEYNLALVAIAADLFFGPPSKVSMHRVMSRRRRTARALMLGRIRPAPLDRALAVLH